MIYPSQMDGFVENTKIGPTLEVTVTYHQGYGIEIRIDSLQNDGSQSWVVIRRGMNKYVTEMSEGNGELSNSVETRARTGKLVATEQKTIMPFKLRKWIDIHPERTVIAIIFKDYDAVQTSKVDRHSSRKNRHCHHLQGL